MSATPETALQGRLWACWFLGRRYGSVDDAALAVSGAEVAEAKAQITRVEKTARLERKAHEVKLEGVRAKVKVVTKKLEQVRYFVESGASPRLVFLKAAREGEGERQRVKAPVAGLVSDARLIGVTTRRATLEVSLLEDGAR